MDVLAKLWKILNPADAHSPASKYMNIVYAVIAAAALIVTFACKVHLPVPGIDCNQAVTEPT